MAIPEIYVILAEVAGELAEADSAALAAPTDMASQYTSLSALSSDAGLAAAEQAAEMINAAIEVVADAVGDAELKLSGISPDAVAGIEDAQARAQVADYIASIGAYAESLQSWGGGAALAVSAINWAIQEAEEYMAEMQRVIQEVEIIISEVSNFNLGSLMGASVEMVMNALNTLEFYAEELNYVAGSLVNMPPALTGGVDINGALQAVGDLVVGIESWFGYGI